MDNRPKIVGVSFQEQRQNWVAHYMQDGKVKHRSFSVKKYGSDEAYKKAVQCRIDNLNKTKKQPRIHLEQHSVKTIQNLSISGTLDALNKWSNHDLLEKLMKETPKDSAQKRLKLIKMALHCILVDLQDLYPRHTIELLDYDKFDQCFKSQILDIWKSHDVEQLKPLLSIYNELFELQKLPCIIEDSQQVMLIQKTASLWGVLYNE
ncbi:hypothetical protein BMR1_03g04637 [Babesia microti strain RI]|uniref:Uncharacterized protein n=1 Tax=Babesia microti (strain RI) TaxID=1133968 RepID=A0A1R4ACF8_BABMR|nr:hypothetical protein BMR1_03g04637 [Babesia microti strain RI]SJK86701.1 hypothetical protein BMR1_03g04637 [Babesia microti strain RI]|eukprot:XP_021338825.1 hypothetical protein BMR1_03g04637 [Babesia microti strain RI]